MPICYDQKEYVSDKYDGCYKSIGYTNASANSYTTKLGYDAENSLIAFPTAVGGAENNYITDYYYQNTGNRQDKIAVT